MGVLMFLEWKHAHPFRATARKTHKYRAIILWWGKNNFGSRRMLISRLASEPSSCPPLFLQPSSIYPA